MSVSKGRGLGRSAMDSPNAHVLRKPAEAGLIQRLSSLSTASADDKVDITSKVSEVCDEVMKLELNSESELDPFYKKMKEICKSKEDLEKCVDVIYKYATKSKWNAHAFAIFFFLIGDIVAEEAKLRTFLLRKLQAVFKEKNKKYLQLDSFLLDVTLLCEIYYHLRLEGKCLKTLSVPVVDYLGMLIEGASQKEVEVLVEQFPKMYPHLRENKESGVDGIINKIRKQIICEPSNNVIVRAMLLQMFEQALLDFKPLSENATNQYKSLSKPVLRICK